MVFKEVSFLRLPLYKALCFPSPPCMTPAVAT